MQIVRMLVWVVLLIALVAFSVANWSQASEVRIWGNLIWQTRLPAVVIVSFLLGLIPTWLVYRAQYWRLERRIKSLEGSETASRPENADAVRDPVPARPDRNGATATTSAQEDAGPLSSDQKPTLR